MILTSFKSQITGDVIASPDVKRVGAPCRKALRFLSYHHIGKNAAGQVCKRVNVDLSGVEHDKEEVVTWVDLEPVTRAQCAIVTGPPSSSPPMSLHVTINVGSSSDLGKCVVLEVFFSTQVSTPFLGLIFSLNLMYLLLLFLL